ncbi:hypothetical protein HA402_001920 [Bradysia odoriphaga]|nr:hypothetical protein HA402_001920 [Bradysia odoriphaga]
MDQAPVIAQYFIEAAVSHSENLKDQVKYVQSFFPNVSSKYISQLILRSESTKHIHSEDLEKAHAVNDENRAIQILMEQYPRVSEENIQKAVRKYIEKNPFPAPLRLRIEGQGLHIPQRRIEAAKLYCDGIDEQAKFLQSYHPNASLRYIRQLILRGQFTNRIFKKDLARAYALNDENRAIGTLMEQYPRMSERQIRQGLTKFSVAEELRASQQPIYLTPSRASRLPLSTRGTARSTTTSPQRATRQPMYSTPSRASRLPLSTRGTARSTTTSPQRATRQPMYSTPSRASRLPLSTRGTPRSSRLTRLPRSSSTESQF